jgi:hypothetical protein
VVQLSNKDTKRVLVAIITDTPAERHPDCTVNCPLLMEQLCGIVPQCF